MEKLLAEFGKLQLQREGLAIQLRQIEDQMMKLRQEMANADRNIPRGSEPSKADSSNVGKGNKK